jgi:replicative DNA helicase
LALIEINPYSYANLIYELAMRRSLISIAQTIATNAYNTDITYSSEDQIQEAETELFNLSFTRSGDKGFANIASSLKQSMYSIQMATENPSHINGVTTGLVDLDKIFAGFQPSDLIIIAARPSMGKTALAVNLALNAAKSKTLKDPKRCYSVGFFSLEMSSEQLSTRILSMEVETNSTQLKTGFIDERKYNQLRIKSEELAELDLFIDDTPALTISSIRTRARRLKRQKALDILFIDYLQLIRSPSNNDNRVQEISEITQGLKALAKELHIPIIALSQLSRAVEQRVDKRPMLSDLRESGSIEQDSDIVMFIYREEYYLSRSKAGTPKDVMLEHEKLERVRNMANVIIAKHRNGPIGDVALHYNNNLGKFSNYTNS